MIILTELFLMFVDAPVAFCYMPVFWWYFYAMEVAVDEDGNLGRPRFNPVIAAKTGFTIGLSLVIAKGWQLDTNVFMTVVTLAALIGPLTIPVGEPSLELIHSQIAFFLTWLASFIKATIISFVVGGIVWLVSKIYNQFAHWLDITSTSAFYEWLRAKLTFSEGLANHINVPGELYVIAVLFLLAKCTMIEALPKTLPIFGRIASAVTMATGIFALVYFHNVTLYIPGKWGDWDAPALGFFTYAVINYLSCLYWANTHHDLSENSDRRE